MGDSSIPELVVTANQTPWLRRAIFIGIVLGFTVGISMLIFVGFRKTARSVVTETQPILAGAIPSVVPKALPDGALTIERPVPDATVPARRNGDGSGSFVVTGTVAALPENAAVYLLLKPVDPAAEEWWVMPPPVVDATSWRGIAYIGNTQYPPKPGYQYALRAVVAAKGTQNGQHFLDPAEMKPLVQSRTVFVTAGSIE